MKLSKLYPDGFKPDLALLAIAIIFMWSRNGSHQYFFIEVCVLVLVYLSGSFITAAVQNYCRKRKQT